MAIAIPYESASNFEKVNWDKARKLFKDGRINKDDEKKLDDFLKGTSTPQEAKDACKALQKKAGSEYSPMLGGILEKIDIAMSVGDLAIKSAPESVGLAWMGIRLCLHSVADDFATFNIFGAACNDIVGIMISCSVFGRMYGTSRGPESFQEIHSQVVDRIPKIYTEILDFSFSVKKYMSRNKAIRIGKGLFAQASAKYSGKIKSIKDHDKDMAEFARRASEQLNDYYQQIGLANQDTMMGSLSDLRKQMELSSKLNKDTLDQLALLQRELRGKRDKTPTEVAMENFEANMKSLNAISDQPSVFATKIAKRAPPKTCTWIFDNEEYKAWVGSEASSLLWVTGGGGLGKSILMSAIIESLEAQNSDSTGLESTVQYFFCKAGDDSTQSTESILRHIISQVYRLTKDLPVDVVERANKSVSSFLKNKPGKSAESDKKDVISFAEAYRTLTEAVGKPAFLVLDALDECNDRKEGLVSSLRDATKDSSIAIKVLVCSRDEADLAADLSTFPKIKVEDSNGPDIKLSAEFEVAKLPGWTSKEREMARDRIAEKAGSFYRYVDLAIAFLKQPWQRPLENHLEKLPRGLEAFYDQIIRKTDPVYVDLLKTCLTYVILANGQIKVGEVLDAYSRTYTAGEEFLVDDVPSSIEDAGEDLHVQQIRIAGSALLDVDSKSRVIQKRHETVADYFLAPQPNNNKSPTSTQTQYECEYCQANRMSVEPFTVSKKYGHLSIATTILRHLTNEAFRKRYLVPFERKEEPSNEDASEETNSGEVFNSNTEVPNESSSSPEEDEKQNGESGQEAEKDESSPSITDTLQESDEKASSNKQSVPLERSPEDGNVAGAGNDNTAEENGKTETNGSQIQGDAMSDDDSDMDSDAGVDPTEKPYEYIPPPDPSDEYRYEVKNLPFHLSRVEELWAPEDRQGTAWKEFEALRDDFFQDESPAFRSWVNLRCQTRYSEVYWVDNSLTVKPIHLAASYGLTSLVEKLIGNQSDLNIRTSEGYTPLNFAIEYYGNSDDEAKWRGLQLLRLFLEAGSDINGVSKESSWLGPPLVHLLRQSPKLDVIRLFLDYKANASYVEEATWKRGVLHLFSYFSGPDDVDIAHALIDAGANPQGKDEEGETPLHNLLSRPDVPIQILTVLIERGADVNAEDEKSQRPLYEVAYGGNAEAARVLIEHNADIMDDDLDGQTALHMACQFGHSDLASLLIEKGARISETDKAGRTAFYLACQSNSEEVALHLIEKLVDEDHNVFSKANVAGKTPLRKAAGRGHKQIVEALYNKLGRDPACLMTQDLKKKQTPLHAAAYNGYVSVVEFILNNGGRTDIQDKVGHTPLRYCFDGWTDSKSAAYEKIALMLIDKDTRQAPLDSEYLNIAATRESLPVVKKLLEAGSDPMKQDEHGWNSVQLALQYGRTEAADLLAKHRAVVGLKPKTFRVTLPKLFRVSESGSEVSRVNHSVDTAASILSDHPIPAGLDSFYFEIEIIAPDFESPADTPEIAIGLCQRPTVLKNWLPGWSSAGASWNNANIPSWAYHGDDGALYCNNPLQQNASPQMDSSEGEEGKNKYTHGDVIGCGIDFKKNSIFFTKNGSLKVTFHMDKDDVKTLSYYPWNEVTGRLHPVVGIRPHTSSPIAVRVNFGADLYEQPFKWEPANETDDCGVAVVAKMEEELQQSTATKGDGEQEEKEERNQNVEEEEEKGVAVMVNGIEEDNAAAGKVEIRVNVGLGVAT